MGKKNLKKAISLFIIGIILGISVMAVFAANYTEVNSNYGYYGPINGYSYMNKSTLTHWGDGNGIDSCVTCADQNYDQTIPAGYMGAKAWLYRNDALYLSSKWTYNESAVKGMWAYSGYSYDSGIYYADGQTQAYNGNGYDTYGVFSSPKLEY